MSSTSDANANADQLGATQSQQIKLSDQLHFIFFVLPFILAALLQPFSVDRLSGKFRPNKIWVALVGPLLLLTTLAGIILLVTRSNLIDFAKVFFVEVNFYFGSLMVIIWNQRKILHNILSNLEEESVQIRDESVMLIRAGHAAMRSISERLQGSTGENSASELVRSIGPLALMWLKKERNPLHWGMAAAKTIGKSLILYRNLNK